MFHRLELETVFPRYFPTLDCPQPRAVLVDQCIEEQKKKEEGGKTGVKKKDNERTRYR